MMKSLFVKTTFIAAFGLASISSAQEVDDDEDFFNEDLEESTSGANVADPFEKVNRGIFAFNDFVYLKLFKPVAKTYSNVMPDPAEKGIGNFFKNIKYPVRLTGNVLQLKLGQASKETGSFLIDTTVGLAGFIDVSGTIPELETTEEDIGQALASWGIGNGFYFVMPFMGPTTLRDFVGGRADSYVDPLSEPWSPIEKWETRAVGNTVELINNSPQLIDIYERVKESAIDPYEAFKDGYLQIRTKQIEE
ncbi:VacJ family lipoprotein [Puniceicoccaceae bacterium K14]|nr:VacJ family lipoprotein [Puniceicoccaceae bacterium K14]